MKLKKGDKVLVRGIYEGFWIGEIKEYNISITYLKDKSLIETKNLIPYTELTELLYL